MRIAILGSGQVGQALGQGYRSHGHEVTIGTRKAEVADLLVGQPVEVVDQADLVVLAVVGSAAVDLVGGLASQLAGKVLVDATNPLDFSTGQPELFVGFDDSLGERVQRAAPEARVVKAYNTVGNAQMVDPTVAGGPPTMFLAGNDEEAKQVVTDLLNATGWEAADLGGIESSRYLEAICMAWVRYGFRYGIWDHAFKLVRP